jgi:hypothetical protein
MNEGLGSEQPGPAKDAPMKRDSWYATFSLLDIGGVVSSSQLRRFVRMILTLWRLTMGSLTDRSRPRHLA